MKTEMKKATRWCTFQAKDFAENLLRDFKSLRSLLNYLMIALFIWVVVWLVLHNAETCGNTIVMTLGATISAIFTNYVWSAHAEKKIVGVIPAFQSPATDHDDPVDPPEDKAPVGSNPDKPVVNLEQPAVSPA